MASTSNTVDGIQDAATSRPMGWAARTGRAARAAVYLVMGALAIDVGLGGRAEVDQRGAVTRTIHLPFGGWLVGLLALGFAAYALWRLSEAAFGTTGEGDGAGPRIKSLCRGLAYVVLAVTTTTVLLGGRGSQSGTQRHLAAEAMSHPGGRLAVALVGAVVVVVGAAMIREGWAKKFLRYFGALPRGRRGLLVVLGRTGTVARGLVFVTVGVLVIVAAWRAEPDRAGGIDEAFDTLLAAPYGPLLVVALGLGLVVFGVYGVAEACWRRVPDGHP